MVRYDAIGAGYDSARRADPYILGRLRELLAVPEGGTALDLACGTGNYTRALAGGGIRITGLDQSARMLAAARVKHETGVWVQGDAARLPFPDGSFDRVLCTLAIHHFPELRTPFAEVARVLRAGRLVLFTSTPEQMRACWLAHYFPMAIERSIEQMPPLLVVEDALAAAGMRITSTEPYAIRDDLQDCFMYSGKRRPWIYLDPGVRAGISTFRLLSDQDELERGLQRLDADIASGEWHAVAHSYEREGGDYLFVVAER